MSDLASGILSRGRGGARLVNAVQPAAGDVMVPAQLVQEHALVEGASVTGPVKQGRAGRELAAVTAVCGLSPAAFRARIPLSLIHI